MERGLAKSVAFDPGQRYADAAACSRAVADAMPGLPGEPQLTANVAQTTSREASFSAELRREPERDLATFIGPMASIAVKRAVRNASDLLELYELLGRQVANPKDRTEFLARGRQRAAAGLGRPRPPPGPTPAKTNERQSCTAQPPNPASIVAT